MMNARAPFSLARPSEDISRPMHDVASVYVGSNDRSKRYVLAG